jgi:hypothetical protein
MMVIKYYLSGKITDVTKELEKANLQKFHDLEKELVARGFEVFNPANLEQEGATWEQYLARDLLWIQQNRPMLYLMEGWQDSRGARLEVEWAKLLGLSIIEPL